MKYIFLLIVFALSACGKKETPSATGQETKSPAAAETKGQAPLPVCDRTPAVRNKIRLELVSQSHNLKKCEEITAQDLNKITELDILYSPSLKPGDFSGMPNLKKIHLWKFEMQQIPKGLFAGLTNLEELELASSQLSRLKAGDFSGMPNLKKLDLSCWLDEICRIIKLPAGIFKGLSRLEELDLWGQPLEFLPAGIFDPLVSLKKLKIWNSKLSETRKDQIRQKCEERNISLTMKVSP